MKKNIEFIISEKRVKLHVFEPSKRRIWTVVGRGKEHWMEPDFNYCSCPGFHFGKLYGKTCYHLESAQLARNENMIDEIIFSDDEFLPFLSGLISDLY